MPSVDTPFDAIDGEPRTRAEAVTDRLRALIISGELRPGTRLRQVEVAEQFAVSTTPVREAFTSLAREGFVRQDAHRGVEVFHPTAKDVRENYEIRLALEPLATELAASRIKNETLAELAGVLDEMDRIEEFELGTELNRGFHFGIYRAADRPLLLDLIQRLRHAGNAYIYLLGSHATTTPEYADAVRREHREILDALETRAPRRAYQAMTVHLRHNLTEISRLVPDAEDGTH